MTETKIASDSITYEKLKVGALPAIAVAEFTSAVHLLAVGANESVTSPSCPAGSVLISGGCTGGDFNTGMVESHPLGQAWRCRYANNNNPLGPPVVVGIQATVLCMETPAAAK